MNDLQKRYDSIFAKEARQFGTKPLKLVEDVARLSSSGIGIEFGAGLAANCFYLAQHGYQMTATDISQVALVRVKTAAEKTGLAVQTKTFQIGRDEIEGSYDIMIVSLALHHVTSQEGYAFLRDMQAHTRSGGYNVVVCFTKDSEFYQSSANINFYLKDRAELEEIYSDWEIISSFEEPAESWARKADGQSYKNRVASILAKKPGTFTRARR